MRRWATFVRAGGAPILEGIDAGNFGEVLLRIGSLTGWLAARTKLKAARRRLRT